VSCPERSLIQILEEVVDVFLEIGGDLVQGGEGRRAFVGLEEGDADWGSGLNNQQIGFVGLWVMGHDSLRNCDILKWRGKK